MFAFISGILEEKSNNIAIINCNGVGFEVLVSETTIFQLPDAGQMTTLFTYMNVREDAITLFGFASKEEKSAFLKLISVSGIGGKMAIAILSAMPVSDLVSAIVNENTKLLCSIKGLGKKTAERLVLELKNSFDDMQLSIIKGDVNPIHSNIMEETIETLVAMGLTRFDATQLVKDLISNEDTTETLIKKCLKNMKR